MKTCYSTGGFLLTNDITTRAIPRQISSAVVMIVQDLMRRLGARTLLISRAMASLGTVSAIIPRSVAIIPHKIADGVRSGLSALTCFPMP